jgi:hypothetical protein
MPGCCGTEVLVVWEHILILPSQRIVEQLHTTLSPETSVSGPPRMRFMYNNDPLASGQLLSVQTLLSLRAGAWCILGVPLTKQKSPQTLCIRSASGHAPSERSTELLTTRWFAQLQGVDLLLPQRSSLACCLRRASWVGHIGCYS